MLLSCLSEASIQVPSQIIVTGCDDNFHDTALVSVLTTISFPLREVGIADMELLQTLLDKKGSADSRIIPSHLLLRESCGCLKNSASQNNFVTVNSLIEQKDALEGSLIDTLQMSTTLNGITDLDAATDFLASYVSTLDG